jgi:secreted trypsin-like serine protease
MGQSGRVGRRFAAIAAIAALSLILTACGSDDGSGTQRSGSGSSSKRATATATGVPPAVPVAADDTVDPTGGAANDPNIVGGTPARIQDTPFLVALVRRSEADAKVGQFCGGSLVAPTLVLTAAHCLGIKSDGQSATGMAPDTIDVVLGRTNLDEPQGERIRVTGYSVPQSWNPVQFTNDIALLRLAEAATATPALLMAQGSTYGTQQGETARIQGWGCEVAGTNKNECKVVRGSAGGTASLKAGTVIFQAQQGCQAPIRDFDPSSMLCARGEGDAQVTCFGDSGGPVSVTFTDGSAGIVGLVSFGESLRCNTNELDIYTYVRPVYDSWLSSQKSWSFGAFGS